MTVYYWVLLIVN